VVDDINLQSSRLEAAAAEARERRLAQREATREAEQRAAEQRRQAEARAGAKARAEAEARAEPKRTTPPRAMTAPVPAPEAPALTADVTVPGGSPAGRVTLTMIQPRTGPPSAPGTGESGARSEFEAAPGDIDGLDDWLVAIVNAAAEQTDPRQLR